MSIVQETKYYETSVQSKGFILVKQPIQSRFNHFTFQSTHVKMYPLGKSQVLFPLSNSTPLFHTNNSLRFKVLT